MINFKRSVLVVAHPDDEILWFSSIIQNIEKIIIVFNKCENKMVNIGRDKIFNLELLPYKEKITNLNIKESGVFNKANWKIPKSTEYGIHVNSRNYIKNFSKINEKLHNELKGYENVITHNPWGENGHEEHVQVFKSIKKISYELNLSVWIPGYFSEQSYRMMSLYTEFVSKKLDRYKIDNEFCQKVKNINSNNNAWTWSNNYLWPEYENFFKLKSKFFFLQEENSETPSVWSQMNFILMYHVHSTKLSIIRSKIIQFLELILPSYVFKLLIKIKNS